MAQSSHCKKICKYKPSDFIVQLVRVQPHLKKPGLDSVMKNYRPVSNFQCPRPRSVTALHKEALYVTVTVRLVTQQKVCRRQKRKYREMQRETFAVWRRYETGDWSLMRLVRRFAHVYRPTECRRQ